MTKRIVTAVAFSVLLVFALMPEQRAASSADGQANVEVSADQKIQPFGGSISWSIHGPIIVTSGSKSRCW